MLPACPVIGGGARKSVGGARRTGRAAAAGGGILFSGRADDGRMSLEFDAPDGPVSVAVDRVINAGYSGRDEAAVRDHIEELVAEGVPAPDEVPATFELAPYATLVDPGTVTVVGERTSGEAEYALIVTGDATYVAAASDQTDRELETEGIPRSKQIAPNVLSRRVWRLADVRDRWDEIALRAYNTRDGSRHAYQDATLAELITPDDLLDLVRDRYGEPAPGTVVLSGTVATVDGELTPGERFEVELVRPDGDALELTYDVRTVPA